MKNIIRPIAVFALAVVALSSCRSTVLSPEALPTHTVKFTSEEPLTKTTMSIDGTSVNFGWTSGDIARLSVTENGVAGTIDTQNSKIQDGKLTVYATFGGEANGSPKTYGAILNGSVGDQTPGASSYDEAADILIAKPVVATAAEAIQFQFRRPVAINKMTLCSLPAGKTLGTVTVSSDKPIAGIVAGDDWNPEKAGNSLKLNVNREIPSSGEVVLYYTSVPAENATLTVKAKVGTDSYYKKFGKTLTTTAGNVKGYNVSLEKLAPTTLTENFNASNASLDEYGCTLDFSEAVGLNYEWVVNDGTVYAFQNGVRLGTKNSTGSISNSTMLADIPAGEELTVKIYAALWGDDGGNIVLGYNGKSEEKAPSNAAIGSPNSKTYNASLFQTATSFTITKVAGVNTISVGSSTKRIIIDKLEIVFDDDDSGQQQPPPPPVVTDIATWLSSYEIPATDAKAVSESDVLYNGAYCHSTVDEVYGSTKAVIYNTTDQDRRIVVHTFGYNSKVLSNYSLLYDKTKKCALWIAYRHNGSDYKDNDVGRNDKWSYDPALPQDWQPDLSGSYSGSYDRGHQVASNERQTTKDQNKQTFYYSNVTPQFGKLNQGPWNVLEGKFKGMAGNTGNNQELYVVTGPLFSGTLKYTQDDAGGNCPLPTGYYKCAVRLTFNNSGEITASEGCAYIVETNSSATNPTLTSIDYVESKTGFDFYAGIPDAFETTAEAQTSEIQ